MIQNLLKDRFKLALHSELKEMAAYNRVVVKKGKNLIFSKDQNPPDDAVGKAKKHKCDLVILDIAILGTKWPTVLKILRKNRRKLSDLIVSAVSDTNTVVQAMRLGASDYIVEPFEEAELELALENVLVSPICRLWNFGSSHPFSAG